ncbi:MAG: sugar transferase, partial [Lachnospiraceae bacterium]|nr:sugar transferase [Lachnospiraceae bacterium]
SGHQYTLYVDKSCQGEGLQSKSIPADGTGAMGVGDRYKQSIYERYVKRGLDILISLIGLIVLSPLIIVLCIVVKISDFGPAIFVQKRVGKNKQFFKLHKIRSIKTDSPHDVPTHMMTGTDSYTTKPGRFLRKSSMDELTQFWDVFIGNISLVGPRPALWNQDWLIAERDKYGANDIKPGLTGWAQINGRDRLSILQKAKLDGDYTVILRQGGMKAFFLDLRCLLGTFFVCFRNN